MVKTAGSAQKKQKVCLLSLEYFCGGCVLAQDIMTKDVITVSEDTPLKDVVEQMIQHRISGLPVVREGMLLGLVTESDLLKRVANLEVPLHLPFIGGVLFLEPPSKWEAQVKKITAINAKEIMTVKVHTVGPNDGIQEISALMMKKNVNRLPVVEEGRLLGIITRSDVIKAVAAEIY